MYLICNVLFHNFITLIILVYTSKTVFTKSILEMSRNLGIDFFDVSKLFLLFYSLCVLYFNG
jgi:hypothetical protein